MDVEAYIQARLEEERKNKDEGSLKEAQEAFAKVPAWIAKGEKLIYPQRLEELQQKVLVCASDIYRGREIRDALFIMEYLADGGSVDAVKGFLEQANSCGTTCYYRTIEIVAHLSKRGPEFYREVTRSNPDWLQEVERENKIFERNLSDGGKQ